MGLQSLGNKRQRDILAHPRTLNAGRIGVSLILAERARAENLRRFRNEVLGEGPDGGQRSMDARRDGALVMARTEISVPRPGELSVAECILVGCPGLVKAQMLVAATAPPAPYHMNDALGNAEVLPGDALASEADQAVGRMPQCRLERARRAGGRHHSGVVRRACGGEWDSGGTRSSRATHGNHRWKQWQPRVSSPSGDTTRGARRSARHFFRRQPPRVADQVAKGTIHSDRDGEGSDASQA